MGPSPSEPKAPSFQAPFARDRITLMKTASERGHKTSIPATIELVHWLDCTLVDVVHWGKAPATLVASELIVLDLTGHQAFQSGSSPNIAPDTDRSWTDLLGWFRRYEPQPPFGSGFGGQRFEMVGRNLL
ncbi:hypothetical protein FSARC_2579 [Fusarium sarcochroum]|uniref:Uncharacterized protein n=1 Tax=Fusarium sarcochroum TaxID=1208366 RepID=A0A8H4U5T9_9HYPO|nr:hypothetical protein FSARC_2579 [Fusarium sarcochroum]